jgi:hypothetical protein
MCNQILTRANVETLVELIGFYDPDAVVDFWNPFACIAARVAGKSLITVIQADMHPESDGYIWLKPAPVGLPTCVPATNQVLGSSGLPSIIREGAISSSTIGVMALVI